LASHGKVFLATPGISRNYLERVSRYPCATPGKKLPTPMLWTAAI